MNEITLPWPDSRLSPNKRIDRRALIAVKQTAKFEAFTLAHVGKLSVRETNLQIKLTFCPPDKRKRDIDNLYASFKAYQDGIFEWLGMDDSLIKYVILQRGKIVENGCVIVELKEMEK